MQNKKTLFRDKEQFIATLSNTTRVCFEDDTFRAEVSKFSPPNTSPFPKQINMIRYLTKIAGVWKPFAFCISEYKKDIIEDFVYGYNLLKIA